MRRLALAGGCLVATARAALPAALGVDLGGEFSKISVTAPGNSMAIVLNHQSGRKTRTAVDLSGETRLFGEAAFTKQGSKPEWVFQHFVHALGAPSVSLRDPRYYPYETVLKQIQVTTDKEKNTKANHDSNHDSKDQSKDESKDEAKDEAKDESEAEEEGVVNRDGVSTHTASKSSTTRSLIRLKAEHLGDPSEIVLHYLSHLRDIVNDFLNNEDVVAVNEAEVAYAVPVGFTYRQRQTLRDISLQLGWRSTGMIYAPMAAALSHSLDLTPSMKAGEAITKIFLDIGADHVQGCAAKISMEAPKGQKNGAVAVPEITQLGCSSILSAGTHELDKMLADHVLSIFTAANNIDIDSLAGKPARRVLREALKVKHNLSISTSTKFYIENLAEGKDLNVKITRDQFDQLIDSSEWMASVSRVLAHRAIAPHLKVKNTLVELLGAGWRVPKIQADLAALVKPAQLSYKCNGDEASAVGANIVAVINSNVYRFKPLNLVIPVDAEYRLRVLNAIPTKEDLARNNGAGSASTASASTDPHHSASPGEKDHHSASPSVVVIPLPKNATLGEEFSAEFTVDAAINSGVRLVLEHPALNKVVTAIEITGLDTVQKMRSRNHILMDQKRELFDKDEKNKSLQKKSTGQNTPEHYGHTYTVEKGFTKPDSKVTVKLRYGFDHNGLFRIFRAKASWQDINVGENKVFLNTNEDGELDLLAAKLDTKDTKDKEDKKDKEVEEDEEDERKEDKGGDKKDGDKDDGERGEGVKDDDKTRSPQGEKGSSSASSKSDSSDKDAQDKSSSGKDKLAPSGSDKDKKASPVTVRWKFDWAISNAPRAKVLSVNEVDFGGKEGAASERTRLLEPIPLSTKQTRKMGSGLQEAIRKDKEAHLLNEIRNKMESLIYAARNRVVDQIAELREKKESVSKHETLLTDLDEFERWLYDEGFTTKLSEVTKKMTQLTTATKHVFETPADVAAKFGREISFMRKQILKLSKDKTWVDFAPLKLLIDDFEKWMAQVSDLQEVKDKWTKEIESVFQKLRRTPNPEKKAKNKNKTKKSKEPKGKSPDAEPTSPQKEKSGEDAGPEVEAENEPQQSKPRVVAEDDTKSETEDAAKTRAETAKSGGEVGKENDNGSETLAPDFEKLADDFVEKIIDPKKDAEGAGVGNGEGGESENRNKNRKIEL